MIPESRPPLHISSTPLLFGISKAMSEPTEPSMSSSSTKDPAFLIHPRHEPFEHGMLPIPKLIFTDPTQTIIPLKQKLIKQSLSHRVNAVAFSESLQIFNDHARLVLDTLAIVLHLESDPLVQAKTNVIDEVGADVHDLVLFLYIQSYKKLLPTYPERTRIRLLSPMFGLPRQLSMDICSGIDCVPLGWWIVQCCCEKKDWRSKKERDGGEREEQVSCEKKRAN